MGPVGQHTGTRPHGQHTQGSSLQNLTFRCTKGLAQDMPQKQRLMPDRMLYVATKAQAVGRVQMSAEAHSLLWTACPMPPKKRPSASPAPCSASPILMKLVPIAASIASHVTATSSLSCR